MSWVSRVTPLSSTCLVFQTCCVVLWFLVICLSILIIAIVCLSQFTMAMTSGMTGH